MSDTQSAEIELQKLMLSVIDELIKEKSEQVNASVENMKGVEGYSIGSKEISTKLEIQLNKLKKDLLELFVGQKINSEIFKFADNMLNSISALNKSSVEDVEKMIFTKQHELMFLKQELDKLDAKRSKCAAKLSELEVLSVMTKRERKHRPDQNPNTKIGRAAMDLVARRKKAKTNLKSTEKVE